MNGINKVILIGNVGKDPELTVSNGFEFSNLSIATTEKRKENSYTEWHRCVCFGKLAEVASKYIKKGSRVYVEGNLKTDKYTDKENIERYTTKIMVKHLIMLDKKENRTDADNQRIADYDYNKVKNNDNPFYDDDVPF